MAVVAVQLGVAVVTLDTSMTSTALPAIASGIGVAPASTIWIINIYYVFVVAALLPFASLGEIHGHRRVFASGLAVFALGALACGLSGSLPALIAGRAMTGLGAAAVSATAPALIRAIFPPHMLGRGLGLYALVVGAAFAAGPTATSAILSIAAWPWLFLAVFCVALAAFALAARGLPRTELHARPFDGISAALCAGMFGCLLLGISSVARIGWPVVALALLLGAALGFALLRRESGRAAPILTLDLFRLPLFSLSSATSACSFIVQGLLLVALPFLFHAVMGHSQVRAGLLITPWPATLVLMPLIAAPLADRVPPGMLAGVGLQLLACGLVSLALMPVDASTPDIMWRLVLCGIGFGFFQSPNMLAIMRSAPANRSGGAGGILAASRLFGQSIGAAIVAICLTVAPQTGVTAALWIGAAFALLASAISLLRLLPGLRQP
jgi:DHA2 family multidrug resistance protein-like MFS transporter